ncbi:MAG: zinc ribbon domain-containing protein [Chloroflexi bacterium]|nr:zinc ribbon domain-containing protein [Chloroflexota bacterium]
MRCDVCHGELPSGAKFCPQCGAAVESRAGIQVRQKVGSDRGEVVGAVLGERAAAARLDAGVSQEIETVEAGGAAVGAIVGGSASPIHVGGQQHYADTVQGDKHVVNTAGGAYVGRSVHTGGGAFVGRDQRVVAGERSVAIGGNVTGSAIVVGDRNVVGQPSTSVTAAEFTRLLAELRAALSQAGLDADTAEVVDADVQVVQEQAVKPKPNRTIIVSKLEGVTRLLTAAAGAATTGEKLLPLAQQAVAWAGQLFR